MADHYGIIGGAFAVADHIRKFICFLCACALSTSLVCAAEAAGESGSNALDAGDVSSSVSGPDGGSVTLDDIYNLLVPAPEEVEDVAVAPLLADNQFPFYGSAYITGRVGSSEATYFFPSSYRDGYYGLDSSGRLYNVSASSISGILYIGNTQYQVSSSSWSYPRYRLYNSSAAYDTLYFYPDLERTNVPLPGQPTPLISATDVIPYIALFLLGGVFLCSMRRS